MLRFKRGAAVERVKHKGASTVRISPRFDFRSPFRSRRSVGSETGFRRRVETLFASVSDSFGESDDFASAENFGQSERPLLPSTSLKPATSRKVSPQKNFFEKFLKRSETKKRNSEDEQL